MLNLNNRKMKNLENIKRGQFFSINGKSTNFKIVGKICTNHTGYGDLTHDYIIEVYEQSHWQNTTQIQLLHESEMSILIDNSTEMVNNFQPGILSIIDSFKQQVKK